MLFASDLRGDLKYMLYLELHHNANASLCKETAVAAAPYSRHLHLDPWAPPVAATAPTESWLAVSPRTCWLLLGLISVAAAAVTAACMQNKHPDLLGQAQCLRLQAAVPLKKPSHINACKLHSVTSLTPSPGLEPRHPAPQPQGIPTK